MVLEKRKPRAYKIADTPYNKALERGKKSNCLELARVLENTATFYGKGFSIYAKNKHGLEVPVSFTVK